MIEIIQATALFLTLPALYFYTWFYFFEKDKGRKNLQIKIMWLGLMLFVWNSYMSFFLLNAETFVCFMINLYMSMAMIMCGEL